MSDTPPPVAFDPAYEAHRLRLTGMTWRDVAAETGYANEIVAQLAVTAYLQKAAMIQSEEAAREALALELARLDAMQEAWWNLGVQQRDEKAAGVLLNISRQRVKLYEMLFASQGTSSPRTIVITGDTDEYVAGLRAIAEGKHDDAIDQDVDR